MKRGATIEIEQLPDGYWSGKLVLWIPGRPSQTFEGGSFHNADEALDWARLTIENAVLGA